MNNTAWIMNHDPSIYEYHKHASLAATKQGDAIDESRNPAGSREGRRDETRRDATSLEQLNAINQRLGDVHLTARQPAHHRQRPSPRRPQPRSTDRRQSNLMGCGQFQSIPIDQLRGIQRQRPNPGCLRTTQCSQDQS